MVHTMKTAAGISGAPRRQHDRAFKAQLVQECLVPGASVAAIALAGGVNANLLFKWRREHLRAKQLNRPAPSISTLLLPVQIAADAEIDTLHSQPSVPSTASAPSSALAVPPQCSGRNASGLIELDIAGAVLRLHGPVDEASLCSVLRALRQRT